LGKPRVMIVYAVAVTLGACLLFLVQPLIAKIILPWFGGTSAVWSAALVFFQMCVLVGYSYAHWLCRSVQPRMQGVIHAALLVVGCALMPILPSTEWRPGEGGDPTIQILLLLAANVGLPSVLLSSTSPLLQVWSMRWTASEVPYWLFALSNFGSMLALLSFPFLLEPRFGSHALAIGWSSLFIVFAALCVYLAWKNRLGSLRTDFAPVEENRPPPSLDLMILWVVLAALASAMLVAVTAHLSVNVAPIPLLWVMPLSLYLLTFILCFGNTRFYQRTTTFPWLAAALGFMAYEYTHAESNLHIRYVIPLYWVALFICCLVCHGELVHRRPAARFLTRFYLLIALGGAIGGIFVTLLAPHLFDTYFEMPLLLIDIAVLGVVLQWRRRGSRRTLWPVRLAMVAGLAALAGSLIFAELKTRDENLLVRRNFYGVLQVRDANAGSEVANRHLVHGTISHGYQFLSEPRRHVPGSYYSTKSGIGRAIAALQAHGPVRYGVIGLGAGVLAGYARRDDYLRIFEINPEVLSIANEYFTFLAHAHDVGADVDVLLGDGRLTLERQPPQNFDLLVVDAFSSDAIPTHLLTREAVDLYFEHLQGNGVLAVHISNRYIDLVPVCLRAAQYVKKTAAVVHSSTDQESDGSVWILIMSDRELLRRSQFEGANIQPAYADPTFLGWTDQYSSVWPLVKLRR
jgi:hypothetical protein